jgi:hypothetical protein
MNLVIYKNYTEMHGQQNIIFLTLHRPCYPVLPFCYYCLSHWLVHLANYCDLLISLRLKN